VTLAALAMLPARTEAQQSVTIVMSAVNGSGQAGTAVLTAEGNNTKVVLTLGNAPGPHPAHIHAGSCPAPGSLMFPLATVVNGRSETTIAAPLEGILRIMLFVEVHKSPVEIQASTSCGDISAGAPASSVSAPAPTPAAKPAVPPAAVAPAVQPSPAARPVAAPAQAPRPLASPAALPRTGEVDPTAGLWEVVAGGVALVVAGVVLIVWRRRSNP